MIVAEKQWVSVQVVETDYQEQDHLPTETLLLAVARELVQ